MHVLVLRDIGLFDLNIVVIFTCQNWKHYENVPMQSIYMDIFHLQRSKANYLFICMRRVKEVKIVSYFFATNVKSTTVFISTLIKLQYLLLFVIVS